MNHWFPFYIVGMNLGFNKKVFGAIVFILVVYWPLSTMLFCMKYDMMDWFLPMRNLIGACLQESIFPVWNPYTNLGYPISTDPQSGALYPIVWVLGYFFGYNSYTINLEFLLHILFAFYGMKKLGETLSFSENVALLMGIAYACSGFFVSNAQHLSWIISAAWIPYVLVYYWRICKQQDWRDALGLALFLFLLLTGGYPAFLIVLGYGLCIVFGIQLFQKIRQQQWKVLRYFFFNHFLALVFFLLQSLVFGIYFYEALPELQRVGGLQMSDIQFLPFSPQSFISFYFPLVACSNVDFLQTDSSMANAYIGILTLFIVGYGFLHDFNTRKRWLALIVVLFFLIALGPFFYLRAFLYHYIPLMDLFKYPSLFRLFAIIGLLLLFGATLESVYQKGRATFFDRKGWYWFLFLFLGGGMVGLYSLSQTSLALPESFQIKTIGDFIQSANVYQLILIQFPIPMILLLLFWATAKYGATDKKWTYLFFIIALDLFLAVQFNLCSTIISDARTSDFEEKLMVLPHGFPTPDLPIGQVNHLGDGSLYPIWYNNNILYRKIAHNGYNNFKFNSYRDFDKHPLKSEILKHQLVYLSPDFVHQDSITLAYRSTGQLQITDFKPHQIKVKVSHSENEQINLMQANYPGWQVSIDGRAVAHFTTDGIFIAAEVPAGEHEVVFQFAPKNYRLFLAISALSFIFVLLTLCFRRRKAVS